MKRLGFSFFIIGITALFLSCSNKKAESTLLSDRQSCTPEDCPEAPNKIDGSLSIESDAGSYQLNMDKSDTIEIAGKCSDLGVRANRILVQAYEGEDISQAPFVDNESSVNCVNSTTPSNNNKKCFWITQGKGIIDSGLEYPQCYNGHFSFSVKLGRLLRTIDTGPGATLDEVANPRRKYMVRFKIRTTDGAVSESAWNSTVVERGVSKPTFSQNSLPATDYKCDVQINAFKNLTNLGDVRYDIKVTPDYILNQSGPEAFVTASSIPYVDPIPLNPIVHVTNYRFYNIVPGVKYRVKVKAKDTKYIYGLQPSPGMTPEEGPFSDDLQCGSALGADGRPVLNLDSTSADAVTASCGNSLKKCDFTAQLPTTSSSPPNGAGVTNSGEYEWMVIKNLTDWAVDYDPIVAAQACNDGSVYNGASTTEGCKPTPGTKNSTITASKQFTFRPEAYPKNTCTNSTTNTFNGSYGVAVRYIDGVTGLKGDWSRVATCPFSK